MKSKISPDKSSPAAATCWLSSVRAVQPPCSGPGMGLTVHHHPHMPKPVRWAKAAPLPAAFVLAQDSTGSRRQSITSSQPEGRRGKVWCSSALVPLQCTGTIAVPWYRCRVRRPAGWRGDAAPCSRGLTGATARRGACPHVTTVMEWVTKPSYLTL